MKKIVIFIFLGIYTSMLNANSIIQDETLCQNGNSNACYDLGLKYANGLNVKTDARKATKLYKKACIGSVEGACFNLAVAYRNGSGVTKDYKKAVDLYQKTCDMGAADGCTNLAFMYMEGLGVDKNNSKSMFFSEKACELGNTGGCYNLSLQYFRMKDYKKAKSVSLKACNSGHSQACYNLGLMYTKGDGVIKNNKNAYSYFSKSCDYGFNEACKYAKSNYNSKITESDKTLIIDEGLGHEYWKEIKQVAILIDQKKFLDADILLDTIIYAFENKYIKDNQPFVSVKTKEVFEKFNNKNANKHFLWIDYAYRYAYFYKAFIANELKQYSKALSLLQKLTYVSPEDVQVYTEMGTIYNVTGKVEKGLESYREAFLFAEKENDDMLMAVALRGMGFSYIELGYISKAKEAYNQSLKIDPHNKIALDELRFIDSLNKNKKDIK